MLISKDKDISTTGIAGGFFALKHKQENRQIIRRFKEYKKHESK